MGIGMINMTFPNPEIAVGFVSIDLERSPSLANFCIS